MEVILKEVRHFSCELVVYFKLIGHVVRLPLLYVGFVLHCFLKDLEVFRVGLKWGQGHLVPRQMVFFVEAHHHGARSD